MTVTIGYFGDAGVTLQQGDEFVSCDDVVTMEQDAEFLAECFEEWRDCAAAGEEGYEYWTTKE